MNARPTPEHLDTLVRVAEESIRAAVLQHEVWRPSACAYPFALREPGAAFVTLRRDGRLMGCIGTLAALDPLVVTVADRARAAALADPRFDPVRPDDLPFLDVEVSVLTPSEELTVAGYDDFLATIRPGIDGLVVEAGSRRATLLPSVWEELPRRADFVAALWRKAGLRPGDWPWGIRVWRYGSLHARHAGCGIAV
jgi:AmmeMemoRadiSam system protein A